MLRSLMTAVTGVRAHQTMLDVTGNNIANANTAGFKKDNTIFQDLMYQSNKLASAPSDGRGGVNPAQVGLGVSVGAIETIFTQGAANYTGNAADMMIQGTGFFVYSNGSGDYLYSRAGANVRDANNDLVQSGTGYKVQGYAMEEDSLNPGTYVKASDLSDVNIPIGRKLEPKATTEVKFQCNLDSRSTAYLPYGYADIPYNSNCGWDGNKSGTARISINKNTCDLTFDTKQLTGVTLSTDANKQYFSIYINDSINDTKTISFDMTGIEEGVPVLALTTASAASFTVGPSDSPTTVYPDYNASTGVFKLTSAADGQGETYFQTNLTSSMNYASFSNSAITTSGSSTTTTNYAILAEFDESVQSDVITWGTSGANPSNLSQTHSTLTLWYSDTATGVDHTPKAVQAEVYFNADGTFASVVPDAAVASTLGLSIGVSDDGTSLVFTNATTQSTVSQINQGAYHQTKQTIYDCDGNAYTMEVNFKKITENRWRWEAFLLDGDGNMSDIVPQPNCGEIEFCGCGPICNVVTSEGTRHGNNDGTNARADIEIPFSLNGSANTTLTLNFGGDGDELLGVTQFASDTTTKAVYQNGYTMGVMEDYSIGTDGTITGNYSNGQRIPLYRVALATFANEQGLEKVGNTMFRATINSGNASIDAAGSNGKGTILAQNTEMSNVDLTEEFTHLIIAQRGFQANTRVITTSDQVLEEVVNLKR